MTPLRHGAYRVGVPAGGYWRELLNTDAGVYGGSGAGNLGVIHAEAQPAHGEPLRLTVALPPLSALFFTPDARQG